MRGVSLGEVVAMCAARLGDDAAPVLARIGGQLGAAARAVPAPDRQRRAEVMALARLPAAAALLRRVDASWIDAALASAPARARTALSAARDETDVWLARRVTADLALVTYDWMPEDVGAWLRRIALEQLAFGLGAQAAKLAALREAAARVAAAPSGRGPQRAAVTRARDARLDDEASLVRVAARALAPHLVHESHVVRAIARRLPRELGTGFEAETSSETLDLVPTWSVLIAT